MRSYVTLRVDMDIVPEGEHSRYTLRSRVELREFHFVGHVAFQANGTVLHDDVDRRNGLLCVSLETRLTVNRGIDGAPNLIVGWRRRQHLDFIPDALNAFNFFGVLFNVLLQIRVSNLAKKFYCSLRIELKCHKVEHADGWAQLAQKSLLDFRALFSGQVCALGAGTTNKKDCGKDHPASRNDWSHLCLP